MKYKSKDYRRDYTQVSGDVGWTAWKVVPVAIVVIVALVVGVWALRVAMQPARMVERTMNADSAIANYEQFQEMFQACQKLNQDLCNMRPMPEGDKMFAAFSKAERMNATRTNLDRWIAEYNAKSRMVNRSLWKSRELPHQLSTTDFACYQERNAQ